MSTSRYSWREFLKKASKEQTLMPAAKYEEYVLKFFGALKEQLDCSDPDQIGNVSIAFLGRFEPQIKYAFRRLKIIELLLERNGVVNPNEHLRQINVIEDIIKNVKTYDKHRERISRIKEVLAAGQCGFTGSGSGNHQSDTSGL